MAGSNHTVNLGKQLFAYLVSCKLTAEEVTCVMTILMRNLKLPGGCKALDHEL